MVTEEKTKKRKTKRTRLDIAAVAIIDNIVFSKSDVWAYYKITNRAFDFLTTDGQASLIQRLTNAFNNLMGDRQESLEMHLIATSVPVDIDLWREQVLRISETWNRTPGFDAYMNDVTNFLKNEAFHQKVVYLGVHLGKRGALNMEGLNIFESGVKGAYEVGKEWFGRALMIPTDDVPATEEAEFRRKEEFYQRNLTVGHLRAKPCTAEEILLLIKRQLYPCMPAPYLDVDHGSRLGVGDLELEGSSAIRNGYRWLEITQMLGEHEVSGCRATLSMTKFPRTLTYPGSMPFFYFIQKMGLPFTTFARFQLHPSKKMRQELEKKKKEQRDELENMAGGMDSLDATISGTPANVQAALEDSRTLSSMLNEDKSAWLEGSYFIVVETVDEEKLRTAVAYIKQSYSDQEININWTAGDQTALFLSQMPGDRRRMTSFDQMTNLAMLAASGMNFSSEVGDPLVGNDHEALA